MRRIAILPVVAGTFLLLATACQPKETAKSTENSKSDTTLAVVNVMTIEPRTISRNVEYYATVTAYEDVSLGTSTPGRIVKIYVETGDRVSKGDLLVQMDPSQLHQAEVQLANLQVDYDRYDTLRKAGGIALQKYDQIKTQYKVLKDNVAFLRENTKLVAPFSGIVSGKYFEDGEIYSGTPNSATGKPGIISLVQITPVKAMVSIPESYFPDVRTGQKVEVKSDTYPGEVFSGAIFRIHPTIDPATRSFVVEVKIPNSSRKLRPGMFCRISMDFGQKEAVTVPAIAVLKLQGSNERYVFLDENGHARRVTVRMGQRFDDQVELISDQIKAGDKLVVSGQSKLLDGDTLKVVSE